MKNKLIEIEEILDKKAAELSIYKLSFQSLYSLFLFTAENIDYKGNTGTAMDYLGRISLIYPLLKKYAHNSETETTTQAILKASTKEHLDDINFLNAYAHFSMLMPQIYRGTLEVKSIKGYKIKIDFPTEDVKESELIDKLYSTISLPISFSYKGHQELREFTNLKAKNRDYSPPAREFLIIKKLYEFHLKASISVEVLSNRTVDSKIGFTNLEFRKFIASLKAFSDYYISLARSYKEQINENNSDDDNQKLMSEYMEFSTCCMNFKTLGWFIAISEVPKSKFDLILSYFIDTYTNNTGVKFESKSYVGEGYQPPITIIDKFILFSPLALRFLLSFNNILYSLNKNDKELFDNEISSELEPVLITQLEYIFSSFKDLEFRKNVNFPGSEIDLMVLSKSENVCLSIQVKTTIAPDSSRTVARVQDRTLEALKQIKKFVKLGIAGQLKLVNESFQTEIKEIKIINLIIVRSCAGSDKGWEINNDYRILNYSMLARILCDKLKTNSLEFVSFEEEILKKQKELIDTSDWGISYENLKIAEYEIEFPNIYFDDMKILPQNLNTIKCFPQFEKAMD